jgi:hypothetical protein
MRQASAGARIPAPGSRQEPDMSNRWWFPFDRMAEFSFRRMPDGWLYCAPNPWLLGPRRYFLVDEERKCALAAEFRRAWCFLFVGIIVVMGVMMPVAMPAQDYGPFTRLVAACTAGLILGSAFNAYLCRRLRPMVAELRPTTRRITRGVMFEVQAAVISRGSIVFFGLSSLALFALTALPLLFTSARFDALSACGALLFGAGTIYWLALYIAQRRRDRY